MYRLLIVDDEEMIVDWLFELFQDLDHLKLEIYKAYSGDEAINWLNKTRIDIVLTDIRMPGIDGLELLKHIRENWPECRVIFLTGYNEFNYVYTAIQYDGVDYLLKTEEDEAIIAAVDSAIIELEKSVQVEKLLEEAKEQIYAALLMMQKEYLMSFVQGEIYSKQSRVEQFKKLQIPLDGEKPVLLLMGRVDHISRRKSSSFKSKYLYGIKILTEKYLLPSITCIHIMVENALLLWYIQPREFLSYDEAEDRGLWEKTLLFVEGTLESIQSVSKRLLNTSISFVLDCDPVSWDDTMERFDKLKLLLNCRIGLGSEMILTDYPTYFNGKNASIDYNKNIKQARLYLKRIGKLEIYLETGNKEEYFQLLANLIKSLDEIAGVDNNSALEIYYSISLTLLSYINRWNLTEELAIRVELYKLTRADEHGSWSNAVEYLYKISGILFELQEAERKNYVTEAIMRIQRYVYEHLDEDLSIVTLAQLVHFNPSYLSRLYKQETGVNLSDFISEAKLNKARELLEESQLMIHEIANAIGYESSSYFNRFFKRAIGMTPQEYRLSLIEKAI